MTDLTRLDELRSNDRNSLSLQIMFDDKLYDRTTSIAARMADAAGFVPKHLLGKPASCYAVVMRAIVWGLDPFAVANATYPVNDKIGFEGKLCHAILERSGAFDGRIKYEMIGDWSKVQGKFTMKESAKKDENGFAKKYAARNWTDADEEGLGVKVIATIKGEVVPEVFTFMLKQAQPRNSTLWATDPVTQIKYLAIRRFANVVVPDIFMGVPFDVEDHESMKDVTPLRATEPRKKRKEANEINDILATQMGTAETPTEIISTAATPPETGLEPAEETAEQSIETISLIMPDGSMASFPLELDTADLMRELQGMMPPDEKEFAQNNTEALKKIISFMQEDGKPAAAKQIEKLLGVKNEN